MEASDQAERLELCIDAVLQRGLADWVDNTEVAWVAKYAGGAETQHEVESIALEVIAALVGRDLMTIGDVVIDGGFREWNLAPAEAIKRVRREWQALSRLGRRPITGDICWLRNTAEGARRAGSAPQVEAPPLYPADESRRD